MSPTRCMRLSGVVVALTTALLLTLLPVGLSTPVASAADGMARLRAFHAVPDIIGSPVDVYVGNAPFTTGEQVTTFDFGESTPYLDVPAGTPLDVRVVLPAGGDPNDPAQAVISTTISLDAGMAYSAVARGTADTGDTADLGAELLTDDLTAPPQGNAYLRVAHFSPDAPAVDIFINGERSNLTNLSYPGASPYVTLPAGTYTFGVAPAGDTPIFTTPPVTLQAGQVATAWAIGLLDAMAPPAQAFTVQPTIDAEYFYLRGVHAVPDIAGNPVDVYINDTRVTTFDFFDSTDYLPLETGVDMGVQVVFPAGGDPVTDAVISDTLSAATFSVGEAYSLVARGTAAPGDTAALDATLLEDDNSAPTDDPATLTADKVRIRVAHFAPDAPNVDIFVNGSRSAITDLAYLSTSPYVELDPGTYSFGVAPTGDTPIYTATTTLEAGQVVTAWANGLLNGTGASAFQVTPTVDRDYQVDVRVLHAAPDAPPVDVLVNGVEAVSDLAFGTLTGYLTLVEGRYDITIQASATDMPVLSTSLFIEGGQQYTVAAIGLLGAQLAADGTPFTLKAIVDDTARPEGAKAKLRLVHLVPDAPNVDLRVGSTVLFDDVAYATATDYIEVDSGLVQASVTTADGSEVLLEVTVALAPGSINTVYAIGQAVAGAPGSPGLSVLPATDLEAITVLRLPIILQ